MFRSVIGVSLILLLCGLLTTASYGQLDGLYEFDAGGDGTSWDDAANWAEITDPNGNPLGGGDPPTPPSPTTSADIPVLGVVVDMVGQTALDVNVGTASGAGSLAVSAGDLAAGRDLNVGSDGGGANNGSLAVSGGVIDAGDDITIGNGSVGTMQMSGGMVSTNDDFNINGGSSVTVSGGTISVGDRLNMSGDASLSVDGGEVIADDDFYFFEDAQITIDSGLLEVQDKLRFDDSEAFNGKLTINGGIVRSNEFGLEVDGLLTDFRGVVEINGDGVFQVEQGVDDGMPGSGTPITQLSLGNAQALIDEGVHFTTSEPAPLYLEARVVTVADFFGDMDVSFVQISVVPEPASLALLALASLAIATARQRT